MPNAFIGHQLNVFHCKRMAAAGAEIGERHSVAPAHTNINFVDCSGVPIRREPVFQSTFVGKRFVNPLGWRPQYSM
jgi:hypothetical protein